MDGLEIGLPIIRPSKVESMTLLPQSLKTGHVYRGKNPRCSNGYVNERQIIWMNEEQVQYNGPAVAIGRNYPIIPMSRFLQWASHDVTDLLPGTEWQTWRS